MKIVALVAFAALVVGCGGGAGGETGPCIARSGSFQVTYTPTSTNGCDLSTTSIVANEETNMGSDQPGCTYNVAETADLCMISLDQTCISADSTGSTTSEHLTWNEAGTHATGLMTFSYNPTPGTVSCLSTLAITYSKL